MSVLLEERNDTLKILSLNRPDRGNSLNKELVDALMNVFDESCSDGTRTLVIKGNGKSFCTGFDLSELNSLSDDEIGVRIIEIEEMLQSLHHAPYVTVALVRVMAFGAGADLVCCCQRRIAAPGSRFCMPGLNFGLLLGTRRLRQRVGVDNSLSVLTNTRIFEADEALRMGFLTQIADEMEWDRCIEASKQKGSAISKNHVQRMFEVVIPDTREQDMEDLRKSIEIPGLVGRIMEYRKSFRFQNQGE